MFSTYSEKICRTAVKNDKNANNRSFSCDTCNESNWLTETDVELHRKEEHFPMIQEQIKDSLERFCTICMRLQTSKEALTRHIKSRHLLSSPLARRIEREIFICNYCNKILFNKPMLELHIINFHLFSTKTRNQKKYSCPKCKKICKIKTMWFHLNYNHELPSMSACDICLTNLPTSKDLLKHLKSHAYNFKCETCGITMSKSEAFEMHLDKHRSQEFEERPVEELVRRVFKRPSKLSLMKYNIHDNLKGLDLPRQIVICVLCREICIGMKEAQAHILRDHLQPAPTPAQARFVCTCRTEFFNRVLLKHHVFKNKGTHREMCDSEIAKMDSETLNEELIAHIQGLPVGVQIPTKIIHFKNYARPHVNKSAGPHDHNSAGPHNDNIHIEMVDNSTGPHSNKAGLHGHNSVGAHHDNIHIEVVDNSMRPHDDNMQNDNSAEPHSNISARPHDGNVTGRAENNLQDMTYVLAEIEVGDENMVTIDSDTNEQVIGF